MNTVRVVRVLSTMLLIRRHGHPTALTTQSERQESDRNLTVRTSNNLTGHHASKHE